VRSVLDVTTFALQASPRVSPRESTKRRKVKLWAKTVRKFCLNADLHVTFRDLLHAVKLRHGTDGFTSFPKEGVLRIFFALKIRRLWPGANPRIWEDLGCKKKGHFHPRAGHKAQKGSRGIDLLFNLGAKWGVNLTPRPLYPCERDPLPLVQKIV
jgi:hypothetical protein